MGFNTSMIVLNDALGEIENDSQFGQNVARAIKMLPLGENYCNIDIRAGDHMNAASVIEQHHVSEVSIIAFGGNTGIRLGNTYMTSPENYEVLLKALAEDQGYDLVKRKTKKRKV